jgi:hypothetical protein
VDWTASSNTGINFRLVGCSHGMACYLCILQLYSVTCMDVFDYPRGYDFIHLIHLPYRKMQPFVAVAPVFLPHIIQEIQTKN